MEYNFEHMQLQKAMVRIDEIQFESLQVQKAIVRINSNDCNFIFDTFFDRLIFDRFYPPDFSSVDFLSDSSPLTQQLLFSLKETKNKKQNVYSFLLIGSTKIIFEIFWSK